MAACGRPASDAAGGRRGDRRYAPGSLSVAAVAFARELVARRGPGTPARAKALLFAASTAGGFGEQVGLEPRPRVRAWRRRRSSGSSLEGCAGVSPATRRTLRTQPAGAGPRARALSASRRRCRCARAREAAVFAGARSTGYLRLAAASEDAGAAAARRARWCAWAPARGSSPQSCATSAASMSWRARAGCW